MQIRPLVVRTIALLHDTLIAAVSFVASYAVVFGGGRLYAVPGMWDKTVAFTVVSMFFCYIFSVNRGSWRNVSVPDLIAIVKAVCVSVVVFTFGLFLVSRAENIPRVVPFLVTMFMIVGLSTPRMLFRVYRENLAAYLPGRRKRAAGSRNVLVYSFTDDAEAFIRSVRRQADGAVTVVGVIDDVPQNKSRLVQGQRVLGGIDQLPALLRKLSRKGIQVHELVVADTTMPASELSLVVEKATNAGLAVSKIPDIDNRNLLDREQLFEPKPIRLSDLLGRPEIKIDTFEVARLIDGKSIVLTGAGGSIGSELARQVAAFNPRHVVLIDSSEYLLYTIDMEIREKHPQLNLTSCVADVRDRDRIMDLFTKHKPDVVFHAAALKHVPLVEQNPVEGIKTNILGTKNVADAALKASAKAFVMISTDKAVNPTNIMGATKRAAESYCQVLDLGSTTTRFKTVRFGNVIGSNGSVVPRFRDQIVKGGPVTVTHPEIIRYFMSIPEAVRLVLQASGHGLRASTERGKILVLDMGSPVPIVELAKKMIQLAGLRPGIDIRIEFTGLRPGEKLYEELFDESEVAVPVPDRGYSIATPRSMNGRLLEKTISDLKAACDKEDSETAVKLLRHIVPEYSEVPIGPRPAIFDPKQLRDHSDI